MIYDNDTLIKGFEEHLLFSGVSINTISTYTHAVSLFSRFTNKDASSLTVDDFKSFIFHLHREDRLAKTTINCYNSCIRRFFEVMLDTSVSIHKVPFYKTKYKHIPILSDSQLKSFFNSISFDPRLVALYTLTYTCGLRISEIRNLKVSDINIKDMTVHIAFSKGGKERTVELCHQAHMALSAYAKSAHLKIDHYLFSVRNGKRPSTETLRQHFKQHLKLANLDTSFSLHVFRHTIATNLLVNGADPFSVMTFLGHSSLASTSRYIHIAQLKKKPYSSALNSSIGGVFNG